MKSKPLIIISTLLIVKIGLAQEVLTGTLTDYPFEAANLLSTTQLLNPHKTGEIEASGKFSIPLDDHYFKQVIDAQKKQLKAHPGSPELPTFTEFKRCDAEGIKITNGDQPVIRLIGRKGLRVQDEDRNPFGHIYVLSDKAIEKSKMFHYRGKAKTGYIIDWFYVENPVTAKGTCFKTKKIRGPENDSYEFKMTVDLNLEPGWNLVKTEVTKVYHAKNGKTYFTGMLVKSLDKIPRGAAFYFFEN